MIQAILFDIEGILANFNSVDFQRNYLGILAPRFAHVYSPDKFFKQFIKSLEIAQNEPKTGQTIMQTFYEDFSRASSQSVQTLRSIFQEFYESDFPALSYLIQSIPQGVKAVDLAIQQGFLTAIATNPVMPLSAMREKVRWAGLNPDHIKVIPCWEEFQNSKPHLGFFSEIAERLGVQPEGCLLVTEHIEDLIGRDLQIKTFLVGTQDDSIQSDYQGTLEDLFRLISQGIL